MRKKKIRELKRKFFEIRKPVINVYNVVQILICIS